MPRKRFSVEQIIHHLREADVLLAQGQTVGGCSGWLPTRYTAATDQTPAGCGREKT